MTNASLSLPAHPDSISKHRCGSDPGARISAFYHRSHVVLLSDEFVPVFHGFALVFVSANPPISKLIRFV
jgi:hypothetical protein